MVILLKKWLIGFTLVLFLVIVYRIIDIKYVNNSNYFSAYNIKSNNNITGYTASRGRILDTNGKVLVDNVPINNVIYRKLNNIKSIDEYNIASKLVSILDLKDQASVDELKQFYIANNDTNYL